MAHDYNFAFLDTVVGGTIPGACGNNRAIDGSKDGPGVVEEHALDAQLDVLGRRHPLVAEHVAVVVGVPPQLHEPCHRPSRYSSIRPALVGVNPQASK